MAALVDNRTIIYRAVEAWKKQCLLDDGSVFGVGAIWTADHTRELMRDFVDRPDEGDRTFEQKLRDQLAPSSAGAKQLAAEMLWVMMLFPSNIGRGRKLSLVRTVWEWSGAAFPSSHPMLAPFEFGIGSGGMGYNNFRPFELQLLIHFMAAWKALGAEDRNRLIAEPWQFADWFDRLPDATSRQLRHMLLHLLFPEQFERVSSRNDKKRIDRAFASLLRNDELSPADSGPSALARDRRLWRIRQQLATKRPGEWLDFYETPDLEARWRDTSKTETEPPRRGRVSEPAPPSEAPRLRRAWAIGAGEGASRWPSFIEREQIAIGWGDLGDLRNYASLDEMRAAIKRTYDREQEPANDALACYEFCREMAVDDEVYVKQGRGRILGHGRIVGEYEYDPSQPDFGSIRRVEWLRRGNWLLPESVQLPTKTLTEVTGYADFRNFMREQLGGGGPVEPSRPYRIEDLEHEAFLPRQRLDQIIASLQRRKNLILQGSPGVGKSFLARRIGYALIGAEAPDNVQMVQFHQSYAYEDFIQGWRPSGDGGFSLRNGVFHEFCQRAQSRSPEPHVFIIDEINRGNLSKVFGELLLLIEGDKRGPEFAIPLTYAESPADTFYVPENVYVLGLMNTADRSLAMVDYALRRRFAFVTLEPAFASPGFRRALSERGVDNTTIARVIDNVGEVNKRIAEDHKNLGPGFVIGHSYFCPSAQVADSAVWYQAVVREEVEPLLDEYWFDDRDRVEDCLRILLA